MEYKRFRIPNRDVKLTDIESSITGSRTFQRLFYLKQLGLAYLVYPCATHTRGGHSIECLDEASKLLESIEVRKGDDGWAEVRMAALLHDIGHVPFSHTLEDENQVLEKHDGKERVDAVLSLLRNEINEDARLLVDRTAEILYAISSKADQDHDWRSDLVGNTVCADLLAYITTDATWTGIEKRPGYYRIYDYFKKAPKSHTAGGEKERLCIRLTKGGLRTDTVSAILDLLDMRYALTERVIFHHAKAIASAMLGRAARLSGLKFTPLLLTMGDEAFLDYLEDLSGKCEDSKAGDGARMLLMHLRSRRLYKRLFKIQRQAMEDWDRFNSRSNDETFSKRCRSSGEIEDLLSTVEDRHELPRGSLVLWCPEAKSGMKLVKANVVWEQSGGWHEPVELRSDEVQHQFPGVHERVMTIEKQYLDLWTFWVGIHPEYIEHGPAIIAELEKRLEIYCDRAFLETYAKSKWPEFEESARLYEEIDDVWRSDLMPRVSQSVLQNVPRQDTPIRTAAIIDAIHAASEPEKKPSTDRKKRSGKQKEQSQLFEQDDLDEGTAQK